MEEGRSYFNIFTGTPEEKRPLGRPRRRWEDNIRKDLKEIGVGLSGLGVTSSPRDPKFAGSNPGEVDEFFQDVKILSISHPGGSLSLGSGI